MQRAHRGLLIISFHSKPRSRTPGFGVPIVPEFLAQITGRLALNWRAGSCVLWWQESWKLSAGKLAAVCFSGSKAGSFQLESWQLCALVAVKLAAISCKAGGWQLQWQESWQLSAKKLAALRSSGRNAGSHRLQRRQLCALGCDRASVPPQHAHHDALYPHIILMHHDRAHRFV